MVEHLRRWHHVEDPEQRRSQAKSYRIESPQQASVLTSSGVPVPSVSLLHPCKGASDMSSNQVELSREDEKRVDTWKAMHDAVPTLRQDEPGRPAPAAVPRGTHLDRDSSSSGTSPSTDEDDEADASDGSFPNPTSQTCSPKDSEGLSCLSRVSKKRSRDDDDEGDYGRTKVARTSPDEMVICVSVSRRP